MYCTYCGDVADTFDHIVPVSYRHNSRNKSENRDMAVPCCRECNSTLQDKLLFTIRERAHYLYNRYSIKYKKILSFPDWSDNELEEMSVEFQRSIRASIVYKSLLNSRIRWLQGMSSHSNDMTWQEAQDEFYERTAAIKSVTIHGLKSKHGQNKSKKNVLLSKITDDILYNKEEVKLLLKSHFANLGYRIDGVWFTNFET